MAKVNDKILVTVDGDDREIFMSFGLLNELTRIIGTPDRVGNMFGDSDLRDEILTAILAERNAAGKKTAPVKLEDVDISIESVERLLEWSSEHLLGFFLRSVKKVLDLNERHKVELEALASSVTGSTDSASKTG